MSNVQKYWFVVFEADLISATGVANDYNHRENAVICADHPIDRLRKLNEKHGHDAWVDNGSPINGPDAHWRYYRLLWYAEIDRETFGRNRKSLGYGDKP